MRISRPITTRVASIALETHSVFTQPGASPAAVVLPSSTDSAIPIVDVSPIPTTPLWEPRSTPPAATASRAISRWDCQSAPNATSHA